MARHPLRVVSVEIKDVLGAREFALQPGQITLLRGRNGTGKSTALGAVQAAIGGGNLAKLARVDPTGGPTEPEVVLVLENETEHYRVERAGEKVRVRARVGDTAAMEDVPKPQTWLSALFDGNGSNPVKFLTAPDKDRALMLLEALPLSFDRAALLAEMGVTDEEIREMGAIPVGLHPLEEIGLIREAVFRTRTGVNRDQKQQAASAEQLRRSIPATIPDDPSAEIADLAGVIEAQVEAIARDEEAASKDWLAAQERHRQITETSRTTIAAEFKAAASKVRREHEQWAGQLRAEVERKIASHLAQVEADITALREQGEANIEATATASDADRARAQQAYEAKFDEFTFRRGELAKDREQLALLRARVSHIERSRALAEQAKAFDYKAEALEATSTRLTAALEALDAYRRRMAENLPIPGLAIEGKVIRVNGVLFEQLNTQTRVEIAVTVATLRAKGQRLPVVFIDGAEALDSAHFDALVEALARQGVQAFVGRVTDEDLTVQVIEEASNA